MKIASLVPEYVELLPPELQDGKLYISKKYGTAGHRCGCGCGTKIVTPLKPTDWRLIEAGGRVSLSPSVGNWNHPCQSHYIIRNNMAIKAGPMTRGEIAYGRALNEAAKRTHGKERTVHQLSPQDGKPAQLQKGWLEAFKRWALKILG